MFQGCSWVVPGCSGVLQGCSGDVPGCSGGVPGCSGVFRGVPGFTDTLITEQATSINKGNKYSCKTISVVFINASSNRFRTKILWIQETPFDGRLLF